MNRSTDRPVENAHQAGDVRPCDEFAVIRDLFAPLTRGDPGAFDLTDDAALINVPDGQELVVTADAMSAGTHFRIEDPPDLIGRKLLRVNLSDLAGKGATPVSYLLTCAWPEDITRSWIERFVGGLALDQTQYEIHVIGGDTISTHGPMSLSLTAFGYVKKGKMLLRSGAGPGDVLYISGTIGDAGLGLKLLTGELDCRNDQYKDVLIDRYQLPQPRTQLGPKLLDLATACLDVSDGLVADAGHMAAASGLGLRIELEKVPFCHAARAVMTDPVSLLGAGDDYELLFAMPPDRQDQVQQISAALNIALTPIGQAIEGEGVEVVDARGNPVAIEQAGYRHF